MRDEDFMLLSAYLDGELEPYELEQLEARLAEEPELHEALDELAATASLIGDAVPMPSEEAWDAFTRDLEDELGQRRGPGRYGEPGGSFEGKLLRVALLAAGLLLAVLVVGRLSHPPVSLAHPRLPAPTLSMQTPTWQRAPSELPSPAEVADAPLAPLQSAARAALTRRGLVQVRAGERLSDALPGPGEPRLLATADASILLSGAVQARAALQLERAVVQPLLREQLALLVEELGRIEREADDQRTFAAARRARERFVVAARLVGLTPTLDKDSEERIQDELVRIEQAARIGYSNLLERRFDYRALRPGALHRQEAVDHARAVAWLTRSGLRLDLAEHAEELHSACLATLALARARTSEGQGALWAQARLEAAVELLFGPPDELTPFDLLAAMRQGLARHALRPGDLLARGALGQVAAAIERRVQGTDQRDQPGQVRRAAEAGRELVLIGATRSLGAVVFSRLSHPELGGRSFPSSLDLAVLFGSRRAGAIVSSEGVLGYREALRSLVPRVEAAASSARVSLRASLERGRLGACAALVAPREGVLLAAQEDPAYRDRLLMAGLAALNTPAPAPEVLPPEPSPDEPVPLVEPLPRLHAQLRFTLLRLAEALEQVAPQRTVLAVRLLRRVARLEEALLSASRDLLEGRKVTPAAAQELRALRPLLLALAPPRVTSVEDVYELAGPGGVEVLHRAVTRADRLYLVALDGETLTPRLGCGPALATCELEFRGRLRAADLDEVETHDPEWASHLSQE